MASPDRKSVGERIDALRRREHAGPALYLLTLALVAFLYYGAGRIGLELAYLNGAVAALWPPAGLGLAVLFLYGVRLWPAIVIGDLFLGDYSTPLGTVLGPDAREHRRAGGRRAAPAPPHGWAWRAGAGRRRARLCRLRAGRGGGQCRVRAVVVAPGRRDLG